MRGMLAFLLTAVCLFGQDRLKRAEGLYDKTDYRASIALLREEPSPDAAAHYLMGRDYFMLGEYKRATDAFQQALAQEPSKSRSMLTGWAALSAGELRLPIRSPRRCMLPRHVNILSRQWHSIPVMKKL